ncbi:efflux transporter periplasmic adaptor subunit [Azoarcus sp. DD4]|uniref:efflux RND transporter periplasmic adaptor subunit n=1 Tax=Azoarcus sp. DD4 TaxID=2027405 RepID=UPI001125EC59|nr:efflux RND transporter periplasmic adaptor subunit [Azoarcus sp. DD4]QDF98541.1 efflux transporter periplasmic adaptor subunit [Azoarcus sp. DD4]
MSARRPVVLAVCAAGLVALGGYAWYANRGTSTAPAVNGSDASAAAQLVPVEVEAVPVETRSMPDDVTAVGTLVSNESVILRPEVAGRIARIHFREGAPVARGTVLVELDAAVQLAELQQAKANLALAEANFRRSEDLFARNFVSQSAREEAASRLEVARANSALAAAHFERTRIRAPFDGVLGIRNVSVGDYIKEGEVLVNIEDIGTLKVDFRLPELYLQRIRPGQTLEVTSDALPSARFEATVDAIDPLVDAQGRSVVMRAKLPNPKSVLRPGMFARVRLLLQERLDVAVVPEEALVPAPGNVQFVYRIEGGKAQRVDVKTGARRDTVVEVTDGVAPGDMVVTAGHLKLRHGAPVRVVPPVAAAANAG